MQYVSDTLNYISCLLPPTFHLLYIIVRTILAHCIIHINRRYWVEALRALTHVCKGLFKVQRKIWAWNVSLGVFSLRISPEL